MQELEELIPPNDGAPYQLSQGQEYTYGEMLELLTIHRDIILTIWPAQESQLRQGLTVRKSKLKKKMEDEGIPVDQEFLAFDSYPSKSVKGAIDVRIKLTKRSAIQVLGIATPDPEL